MANAVLITNLAATLFMIGLIWTIQIVHYPMFDRVGDGQAASYLNDHGRLITWVVGPPMLVELATSVMLAAGMGPAATPLLVFRVGLAMLVAIWISTWLLQVPCHQKLCQAFDIGTHRRLVQSNWIRTALWSARGALMIWAVMQTLNHKS